MAFPRSTKVEILLFQSFNENFIIFFIKKAMFNLIPEILLKEDLNQQFGNSI